MEKTTPDEGGEDEEEEDEDEDKEEDTSRDEDDEERSLPGDTDEEVSTATRAKQLAERLKATACKVLRDLGRILAISLLGLAGTVCLRISQHMKKSQMLPESTVQTMGLVWT